MSGAENLQCVPGREFLARWRIKNASMFGMKENQDEISPTFKVPILGNTKWYLKLLFKGPNAKNITCFLWRSTDDEGPEYVKVFYSISVGSSFRAELQTFSKNSSSSIPEFINRDKFHEEVLIGHSKDVLLQIECRLWPDSSTEVPIPTSPYPVGIEMVTTIQKETRSIFQKIPNFSKLQVGQAVDFFLDSAESADYVPKLMCRLLMNRQTLQVTVHEAAGNIQFDFMLKCKVHLLDAFGVRRSLYHGSAVFEHDERSTYTMIIPFALSKNQLMEKKDLYLPGDELLLHWEFAYASNKNITSFVERTLYDKTYNLQVKSELKLGIYLEQKYNEHRFLFRLLAVLAVVLSVLPHLLYENTL